MLSTLHRGRTEVRGPPLLADIATSQALSLGYHDIEGLEQVRLDSRGSVQPHHVVDPCTVAVVENLESSIAVDLERHQVLRPDLLPPHAKACPARGFHLDTLPELRRMVIVLPRIIGVQRF